MNARKASRRIALESTAYHEAGHVVAAFSLGCAVKSVTIIPDPESGSLGQAVGFPCLDHLDYDNPRHRALAEERIIILLAGGAAEAKFRGRRCLVGARGDRDAAVDAAVCLWGDVEETIRYVRWLECRAANLIGTFDNWQAVKAVAAELLDKKTLNGRDAKAIYLAARLRGWTLSDSPGTERLLVSS